MQVHFRHGHKGPAAKKVMLLWQIQQTQWMTWTMSYGAYGFYGGKGARNKICWDEKKKQKKKGTFERAAEGKCQDCSS